MSGDRWLLDTYCKAGGAGEGYARAGWRVIGVDIEPQPHYPHEFHQGDALAVLDSLIAGQPPWPGAPRFSAAHGSPPCHDYTALLNVSGLTNGTGWLLAATRDRFQRLGLPWVIENVDGSGLARQADMFGANGVMLCGLMFGLELQRHRLFESSAQMPAPHHPRHLTPASRAGHWEPGTIISIAGNWSPIAVGKAAMGIDWMTAPEMAQAIPPAYTEYLGRYLMEEVTR